MNFDFESIFFDQTVEETLFYSPKIEIKPVHLANGLFRAVCGKYAEAHDQHTAIYPKAYPNSNVNEQIRGVLNSILSADGALFARAQMSSYTLSHVSHITSDNHDRGTGEWLFTILDTAGEVGLRTGLAEGHCSWRLTPTPFSRHWGSAERLGRRCYVQSRFAAPAHAKPTVA